MEQTLMHPSQVPLLGIRRRVLFPGELLRLTIGRPKSVKLVESIWDATKLTFKKGSMICISTLKPPSDTMMNQSIPTTEATESENLIEERPESETIFCDDVEVFAVGCVARVLQLSRVGGAEKRRYHFSMLVEGISRAKIEQLHQEEPFSIAQVQWLNDSGSVTENEILALAMNIRKLANDLFDMQRKASSRSATIKLRDAMENIEPTRPGRLGDFVISNLDIATAKKQQVLEEQNILVRLKLVLYYLNLQMEMHKMSRKIQSVVEGKLKNNQREYFLRQQLKAIQDELRQVNTKGDGSSASNESPEEELKNKVLKADLPPEVETVANRELERLEHLQPQQPEYAVIRTYLEWIVELPWKESTADNLNVEHAKLQLDNDHFGLQKVKKRMVEYLAVRSLRNEMNGPIICLVGPPGVGKTSLGKSIATAMGRNFRRIALGGVRDEAEIRGHRKTYVGAMPGNIVQAMKRAKSNNPVILLDEIDKLGSDNRGDPSAALLEVLDPEQNSTFTDHYLNVPMDLSNVLFIATANSLDTIPSPLRDRMEIIQVPGYTTEEKVQIAIHHLLPKQLKRHGITNQHVQFEPDALRFLLNGYTREAGVRNLDREVAAVCRFVAVKVAEARDQYLLENPPNADSNKEINSAESTTEDKVEVSDNNAALQLGPFDAIIVTKSVLVDILGPHRYESEIAQRTSVPGVATGMAWTQVGGEILFIEASLHRGNGRLQLTGQLGKVMEESVRTALSFVRAHLDELGLLEHIGGQYRDIEQDLEQSNLHVHFPAGGVPKDGPSAGVAVTAAIVSAISGRCIRHDTACTGEITLRGLVLPVGGIKEKVLAAHRAGIKRVLLPERNGKDLPDIPIEVQNDMEIIFVSNVLNAMEEMFLKHPHDGTLPSWRAHRRSNNSGNIDRPPISNNEHSATAETTESEYRQNWKGVDLVGPLSLSYL